MELKKLGKVGLGNFEIVYSCLNNLPNFVLAIFQSLNIKLHFYEFSFQSQ